MLKKIISKISAAKTQAHQLPFWQWIERKEKIRRLGAEVEHFERLVKADPQILPSDFKDLLRTAKAQQELLTKK